MKRVGLVGMCVYLLLLLQPLRISAVPRGRGPPSTSKKWEWPPKFFKHLVIDVKHLMAIPQGIEEIYTTPPKPLQVFEYGPSRRRFMKHPEKYKYQYVCVMDRRDPAGGVWHRRKAPTNWVRTPPFHVRVVRVTAGGMLHYMLTSGKARIEEKEVPVTIVHKKTGKKMDVRRKMKVLVKTADEERLSKMKEEEAEKYLVAGELLHPLPPKHERWGPWIEKQPSDKKSKQDNQ